MNGIAEQANILRTFNRFYTSAIGVLTDRYLGQARPLGEARLLFEVGLNGAAIKDLRDSLQLDAGYLSRLVHSLQRQGLVRVSAHPSDQRIKTVELTAAGRTELQDLDERSTAVAVNLLAPLTDDQRRELISALELVRRHLRLAAITIEVIDPESAVARSCLAAYAAEIAQRFPEGFDSAALVSPAEVAGERGAFVVASEQQQPVACGVLRTLSSGVGEIRHVWVHPSARRLGLGRRLLAELEDQARARKLTTVRLDTHRVLTEAIDMYRSSGYQEIAAYGDNPYAHFWFEKKL